jgi:hypothetical protein
MDQIVHGELRSGYNHHRRTVSSRRGVKPFGTSRIELLNALVPLDEIWSRPEAARFSTFSPEWNIGQRTSTLARS